MTSSNGTILYQNPMTSEDILQEYGVATNQYPLCLDGSKRDRVVWTRDFVHTARTVLVSTNRTDHILEVVDFEFGNQVISGTGTGYTPSSAPMGISDLDKNKRYPAYYAIDDYQIFFLVSLGDHFRATEDLPTASKYWNQTAMIVNAMLGIVDPTTGLMVVSGNYFFCGSVNGTAQSALMVIVLNH